MDAISHHSSKQAAKCEAAKAAVAILTGGADKPYALGLASSLLEQRVPFDFVGSDVVDGPELHGNPLVRFLNLRGDQSTRAGLLRKVWRVLIYYCRLLAYAVSSPAGVFHILWNNKLEYLDRTLLLAFYRLCGKRIVLTAHNVNIRRRDGNDSWLNRSTLGMQYRLAAHIFVHTQRMKEELQHDFGTSAQKISVIPFGINATVPNTSLIPAEARVRLGLEPHHRVVLFFGNIAPYKGLEFLVDAVAGLIGQEPNLRLVIAGRPKGEPAYWAGIERRISEPKLREHIVKRIEYVPDADTEVYFKAADVLVLPYTHIFQSGVLFLGYYFGLPVIAADVGSLREDVVEGKTGSVCRPKDPVDLARRLADYFAGDLYRQLHARRSDIQSYAGERYSWSEVGKVTSRVYAGLKAGG